VRQIRQRTPAEIFAVLRSLIDARRRPGRFLILGSASRELIRQNSESLAGRIAPVEEGYPIGKHARVAPLLELMRRAKRKQKTAAPPR